MSKEGWNNLLQQDLPIGTSSINGNDLLNKFMAAAWAVGCLAACWPGD